MEFETQTQTQTLLCQSPLTPLPKRMCSHSRSPLQHSGTDSSEVLSTPSHSPPDKEVEIQFFPLTDTVTLYLREPGPPVPAAEQAFYLRGLFEKYPERQREFQAGIQVLLHFSHQHCFHPQVATQSVALTLSWLCQSGVVSGFPLPGFTLHLLFAAYHLLYQTHKFDLELSEKEYQVVSRAYFRALKEPRPLTQEAYSALKRWRKQRKLYDWMTRPASDNPTWEAYGRTLAHHLTRWYPPSSKGPQPLLLPTSTFRALIRFLWRSIDFQLLALPDPWTAVLAAEPFAQVELRRLLDAVWTFLLDQHPLPTLYYQECPRLFRLSHLTPHHEQLLSLFLTPLEEQQAYYHKILLQHWHE